MRNERNMLQKLTNTDSEIRNLEFLTSMTGSPIRDFLEIRNILLNALILHMKCISRCSRVLLNTLQRRSSLISMELYFTR